MITKKGMPITGGTPKTSKKAPFVPDAKDTSSDEQTMIKEPPTPFKNNKTAAQMPAASAASGGISTMEPRIASGLTRTSPGVRALPPRGPVGQRTPINQSGQMNGRMGTSFPRKVGGGDLPGKFPSKRNARFYGE
jgi:hypothetical protein